MPPEHEYKQMISPKNDVFSLGVIIIEVVDGPTGYCNFREMDDVIKFIHLVREKIYLKNNFHFKKNHTSYFCTMYCIHTIFSIFKTIFAGKYEME